MMRQEVVDSVLNSDNDFTALPVDTNGSVEDREYQQIGIAQLLKDAHRSLSRSLAARITQSGVSIGQWYFLRALWQEDGLTQRELSQRVGMMEPTTVTALNGMEKRGLVERVRNAHDRRKMNIYLTDKGRSLQSQLRPVEDEVSQVAIQGVPPQQRELFMDLLRLVILNLNDDGN